MADRTLGMRRARDADGRLSRTAGGQSLQVVPAVSPSIRIYEHDPIMWFLSRHRRSFNSVTVFLIYFAVFVVGKVAMAYAAGVLTSGSINQMFEQDLQRFPPFAIVLYFFRKTIQVPRSNTPVIPYFRDYIDMGIMTLMAAHMVLLRNQWHTISGALTKLYRGRILNPTIFSQDRYETTSRKFHNLFNWPIWSLISWIIAITVVAAVYYSIWTHGIYSGLNWPWTSGWEKAAFQNWWANPMRHPGLFIYSSVTAVIISYYMVRHNMVGICSVLLCREVLSKRYREPILVLHPDHEDGLGGVRVLRTIMIRVYESIIIMGASLMLLYFYLPQATAAALFPFCLIFFVLNPFYVILPLTYIRRRIRQSKARQRWLLQHELQEILHRKEDASRRLIIREQLKKLSCIPELLFAPRNLVSFSFTYAIPVVTFIDWVVRK